MLQFAALPVALWYFSATSVDHVIFTFSVRLSTGVAAPSLGSKALLNPANHLSPQQLAGATWIDTVSN